MNKKYFIAYYTPVQWGNLYHTGGHPLLPANYDKIVTGIATKINLANGLCLPKESVCIVNVIEMPSEPVWEPEFCTEPLKALRAEVAVA